MRKDAALDLRRPMGRNSGASFLLYQARFARLSLGRSAPGTDNAAAVASVPHKSWGYTLLGAQRYRGGTATSLGDAVSVAMYNPPVTSIIEGHKAESHWSGRRADQGSGGPPDRGPPRMLQKSTSTKAPEHSMVYSEADLSRYPPRNAPPKRCQSKTQQHHRCRSGQDEAWEEARRRRTIRKPGQKRRMSESRTVTTPEWPVAAPPGRARRPSDPPSVAESRSDNSAAGATR